MLVRIDHHGAVVVDAAADVRGGVAAEGTVGDPNLGEIRAEEAAANAGPQTPVTDSVPGPPAPPAADVAADRDVREGERFVIRGHATPLAAATVTAKTEHRADAAGAAGRGVPGECGSGDDEGALIRGHATPLAVAAGSAGVAVVAADAAGRGVAADRDINDRDGFIGGEQAAPSAAAAGTGGTLG